MTTEEASEVASVLANTTRLEILQLLHQSRNRGLIVGEIQKAVGLPGSTLSHHLERLKESGLVTIRRQGTFLWYIAVPDRVRSLADLLLGLSAGTRAARKVEIEAPPEAAAEVEIEAD